MTMTMDYHNPVLLKETVDGLNINPDGVWVDVMLGGGGHSKEILRHLGPNGKLFAFDQDEDALANALEDERFTLIGENLGSSKGFCVFTESVRLMEFWPIWVFHRTSLTLRSVDFQHVSMPSST